MTCFHPNTAYRRKCGGRLTFNPDDPQVIAKQEIPCGQCFGCRRDRAMRWGIRCMHEASLYPQPFSSIFINPTYDDEHLPEHRSLRIRDTQLFMMRLRKDIYPRKVRFFMAGEYGPKTLRPHYHGMLFGYRPDDMKPWKKAKGGAQLYKSETLERLWGKGTIEFGAVTFQSAAYCAQYAMKKLNGELGREAYRILDENGRPIPRLDPETGKQLLDEETGELFWEEREREFAHQSRRPGIGAGWLAKYGQHTFAMDYVIVHGRKGAQKSPIPKYYDRLFEKEHPDQVQWLRFQRQLKAERYAADSTPERLEVREECAKAKMLFYQGERS